MLRKFIAGMAMLATFAGIADGPDASAAADTLSLSMPRAEQIFLEKNLSLLAEHYHIEAGKALALQARLWDNPVLNTDQNVYSNHRWFEHHTNSDGSYRGQYFLQVTQLIRTAGKRSRLMDMATTSTEMNEWQFREVLRTLKFQLRSDLYTVGHLQTAARLYSEELQQLDKLLTGMDAQLSAGNIARKDYLRVQALQMATRQEAAENEKQMIALQSELKTLLSISGDTLLMPEYPTSPSTVAAPGLDDLYDRARQNNAAYRLQQLQLQYRQQDLAYQKALAVPDITVGPSFDKNSNYTTNYVGLGLSLPLPLLNRNQGNIRAARNYALQEGSALQLADVQLRNDVNSALSRLLLSRQLYTGAPSGFYQGYGKLYQNVVESYRQRQISLVEFIDYFSAYKESMLRQSALQLDVHLAQEELNYQVGADVL